MRSAVLVLTLGLTLVTGSIHAETNAKADVGNGHVVWFDVTTTDLAKSKEFYGKLFDWQFAPLAGTDKAFEIKAGGTSIGTLRGSEGAISSFNGVVYIQVADITAACAKAKELGAFIPPGFPFDLPEGAGAIAIFADTVGHPMGMYSQTPLAPAAPAGK